MYKLLLCWRYLRTRYIALASIVSVMLGVATMIVVNSVMEGFRHEMQERIHGILSDVVFESMSLVGFYDPQWHMEQIRQVAGEHIEGMTATVVVPAMLNYQYNDRWMTRPVQLIGIDEETQNQVGDFGKYLQHPENRRQISFDLRDGGYDVQDHQAGPEARERLDMAMAGWKHRRRWVERQRMLESMQPAADRGVQAPADTYAPPAAESGGARLPDETSAGIVVQEIAPQPQTHEEPAALDAALSESLPIEAAARRDGGDAATATSGGNPFRDSPAATRASGADSEFERAAVAPASASEPAAPDPAIARDATIASDATAAEPAAQEPPAALPLEPSPVDPAPQAAAPENPFEGLDAPENRFDPLHEQHTGVVLGIALASYRDHDGNDRFLALPGDDVKLSFPTAGTPPEVSHDTFTVVDFYESKMSEYDASFVFMPIEKLQRLRGMFDPTTGVGYATSIQIKLKPGADGQQVRDLLRASFVPQLYNVSTWRDKQGPLLAAVQMETAILNVLLFMIIAVAGFGILAIFFMIVVEKTRDIGILKSLGASSRGILGIFLGYGLSLGLVGAGVGLATGLLFVAYINEIADLLGKITGQEVFDPSIYYFQQIPTIVDPLTVAWIVLGALVIAVLASVLPARRASRLHPVEALRYE